MELRNKKILIISPEAWGENFVSKHHYARELAKCNKVYFLNPPTSFFAFHEISENLRVIDYAPVIRGVNRFPSLLRDYLNSLILHQIKKRLNITSLDVVWNFDPFRFQNLFIFHSPIRIYHPVDVHNTKRESEVAESASVILTTNDFIKKKLDHYKSKIFNIGHGLSNEFILKDNIDTSRSGPIKVCMMGNMQRKIDYPLLFYLIEQNPNIEFHFIGPYSPSNLSHKIPFSHEIDHLKSFDNCYLYGSINRSKLPVLLNRMDVFLILYRENENPASIANPHKLLEYLSTGKIVLSNYMEEYSNKEDLLVMTKDRKEIPVLFKKILDNLQDYNRKENVELRRNYAYTNSYESKITLIESLL